MNDPTMSAAKRAFLVLACLSAAAWADERGAEAAYVGGTLEQIQPGAAGRASTIDSESFVFSVKQVTIKIPYERINLIEYGMQVDRRLVEAILISPLMILSKKRKHFLTVGFETGDGRQQAMLLRVDKSHIRAILVSLEARTGRKVTYQDEEARKAGKG
jgi:hypothetical protein